MKVSFLGIAILFFHFVSFSQEKEDELLSTENSRKHTAIRLVPSLFWNTFGIEFEKQLGNTMSIGLNGVVTYGRNIDNDALTQAVSQDRAILNQGFAIDLIGKKYFNSNFDQLFLLVSASYNTIEYFNIDKRPFTLFNQLKDDLKKEILENDTRVTNAYGASLGVGYQILMIPKHIIINIEGGVAAYTTITNVPFFLLYFTPSIGYKF